MLTFAATTTKPWWFDYRCVPGRLWLCLNVTNKIWLQVYIILKFLLDLLKKGKTFAQFCQFFLPIFGEKPQAASGYFLSLVFRSLIMMGLGVDFFDLFPIGIFSTSWICDCISFPDLGVFFTLFLHFFFFFPYFMSTLILVQVHLSLQMIPFFFFLLAMVLFSPLLLDLVCYSTTTLVA